MNDPRLPRTRRDPVLVRVLLRIGFALLMVAIGAFAMLAYLSRAP